MSNPNNEQKNSRPVVLILEDERPLLEAITKKLELNGFDPVTCRTVDQGLAFLDELEKVDVVWLDHYLLGDKSGLDFVKEARVHNKGKQLPIFVVSNTATEEKKQAYIKMGITKYYTKADYRLDTIINDIKTFLENTK